MNTILASIWRKIINESLKAFATTCATVIATKGVEHIYDNHVKPKKIKKKKEDKKNAPKKKQPIKKPKTR